MEDFPPIPDFLLRAPRPTPEEVEAEIARERKAQAQAPAPGRGRWQKRKDDWEAWQVIQEWLRSKAPTTLRGLTKARPEVPKPALRRALRKACRLHLASLSGKTYTPR